MLWHVQDPGQLLKGQGHTRVLTLVIKPEDYNKGSSNYINIQIPHDKIYITPPTLGSKVMVTITHNI